MTGRIIFYNPHSGKGKILTKVGRKFDFSVEQWEDFDVLPETGIVVSFAVQGEKVTAIASRGNAPAASAPKVQAADVLTPATKAVPSMPPARPRRAASAPSIPRNMLQDRPEPAIPPKFAETSRKLREVGEKLRRAEKGGWLDLEPTYTIQECAKAYFQQLGQVINRHKKLVQQADLLDYSLMKRFLFTAYHDLYSLDSALFYDSGLQRLKKELVHLEKVTDDLDKKIHYPKYTFEQLFLRQQPETNFSFQEYAKRRIEELNRNEIALRPKIKLLEEKLASLGKKNTPEGQAMEEELREARGDYVDAVHESALLSDQLRSYGKLRNLYTERYLEAFGAHFQRDGAKYKKVLGQALNAMAHDFDALLWEKASKSNGIRRFFENAGIKGSYNTLVFLNYYLKNLDVTLLREEHEKLFKLKKYLEEREGAGGLSKPSMLV